jgi:hypothetical protein
MDLHRRRKWLWFGVGMLVVGLALLAVLFREWDSEALILDWKLLIGGPGGVLVGALFLYSELRPLRCRIDEHGLTLRLPDEPALARSIAWSTIEAIMLEPRPDGPPRLVLVPVPGADVGVRAEYVNRIDGRPSIILLDTGDVTETPSQISAALRHHAGSRYTQA